MTTDLVRDGYFIQDSFLSVDECDVLLDSIASYRRRFPVPEIYRNVRGRPLRYLVIDGDGIQQHLPLIFELLARVNLIVNELAGEELTPLGDMRVACNVNITRKGGSYRWHYDRNRYTALLYLNRSTGGETELCPRYRLRFGRSATSGLQRMSDRLVGLRAVRSAFGRRLVCTPEPGRLLVMKGDECLHSVRPVLDDAERINIILSYDRAGTEYPVSNDLDTYLYTDTEVSRSDPNYSDS